MADGGKAAASDIPSWLLPEAGRLCKGQEFVPSCGTAVLARWEAEPGPRVLVAAEEFGIGPNACEPSRSTGSPACRPWSSSTRSAAASPRRCVRR